MKAWTLVCSVATLALSTVNAGNAAPQECDLIKIFSIVKPLESNDDVKKCIAATGYELLPPANAPTKDQVAKLCDNTNCKTVFATLQKMDIPDCTISLLGGLNMKKVINDAFGQCSSSSTGSSNPAVTTAAPSPSVTPSVVPTNTPAGSATPVPATSAIPAPAASATPAPAPAATTPAPVSNGNAKLPTAPTPAPAPVSAPAPNPTSSNNKGKSTGKIKLCDA